MARPKKDKYESLSDDFKNKSDNATDEALLELLGEVAKSEELNRRMKADDQELQEQKAKYEMAGEQYKDTSKANKLKTSYIYDLLRARGKAE